MPLKRRTATPVFELTLVPGEAPCVSVCTKEREWMAREYELWTGLRAEVIGTSVDSAYVNARFAKDVKAPFPIVSDFNKKTIDAYDVRNDDYFGLIGVSNRAAFAVDRDGMVAYSWMSEDRSLLPPFDEIEQAVAKGRVRAAAAVATRPGAVLGAERLITARRG